MARNKPRSNARSNARSNSGERTATRELRRQQLIESTIASIAKRGLSYTTMANVAEGARLSHGIVNFHFRSKEQLLIETLRYVVEEYRSVWTRAVEKAGPVVADKLSAFYLADLDPAVCTRKKLAVWHAFYGEAKSRPTYREICDASDQERIDAGIELAGRIIAEGGYRHLDPRATTRGLDALSDGLWLHLLLSTDKFDRDAARETLRVFLACLFPEHFPLSERDAA